MPLKKPLRHNFNTESSQLFGFYELTSYDLLEYCIYYLYVNLTLKKIFSNCSFVISVFYLLADFLEVPEKEKKIFWADFYAFQSDRLFFKAVQ